MTRKFLIWTRGYAGPESRIAVTSGDLPKLFGLESIAHEIKSCASPNPLKPGELPIDTSRDNT
jgi:hypothetical protein